MTNIQKRRFAKRYQITLRRHLWPRANGSVASLNEASAIDGRGLRNTRRTVLSRVTQEVLINVACHARAQLVTVRIHKVRDTVCLAVHDNGRSFRVERILSSNTPTRAGLLGTLERVERVGGTFSTESVPGKGTTVRAEIPFHGSQQRRII